MPRKMRVEYPGAIYHIMSRGDRREDIFLKDVDRQDFIKTLAETCQKTGFQVHAYCLMSNCNVAFALLELPKPTLRAIAFKDNAVSRRNRAAIASFRGSFSLDGAAPKPRHLC